MGTPLTQWRCDVCGETVGLDDGYVVWKRFGSPGFEFRIIHKSICDIDGQNFTSSLALRDLTGPDGLVKLTSWLSYGAIDVARDMPTRESHASSYPLPPLDAWVDLVRRVQVPYYEETRVHFHDGRAWDFVAGGTESWPYLQHNMEHLRQRMSEQEME